MNELRILFTGTGRRIELIQAFKQAALELGVKLTIYGADMNTTAPALAFCDQVRLVCSMKDPEYISELSAVCCREKIDLVIPTIDTDLLILSQNIDSFGKTKVLVSAPDKIRVCRDKNNTSDFFESCGCKAPRTVNSVDDYEYGYPCFIKPKDGSSSINAFKVNDQDELLTLAQKVDDYIIQPFIDGTEYTVDIFCDFNGKPMYITPRVRLQVRAGEVLKTKISLDKQIITECERIVEGFKPVGPITVQLIRDNKSGEDYYIEINPRFGGGAPLSMKAGADSAKALLEILLDKTPKVNDKICDGAVFSRFDQSVCIESGKTDGSVRGVIFDLDDTLYSEKQYVRSGFKAIERYLNISGCEETLWSYFEEGKTAIDSYLEKIRCTHKKNECLEIYRTHKPEISLYDGARDVIENLKQKGIRVGIITDGRPVGQRNKIEALGLVDLVDDIIVTDELGGEQFRKPCDIAFRIMQTRWKMPFGQIMYVGDNVNKDFCAPKQLGMRWIWMKNPDGLYLSTENFGEDYITSIFELLHHI